MLLVYGGVKFGMMWMPLGPRFVYITFFDVVKNTNFELHNEILNIPPNFIRQVYQYQLKFIVHNFRMLGYESEAKKPNSQIA